MDTAFWGFSPARDLLADIHGGGKEDDGTRYGQDLDGLELNLLLVGASDPRHLVATLAALPRHAPPKSLSIVVVEPRIETLARHLLLLLTVHDFSLALDDRVHTYLAVFANALVSPGHARYIREGAAMLEAWVLDGVAEHAAVALLDKLVDVGRLKHKEQDALAGVFRSWAGGPPFDIRKSWEERQRSAFKDRFDVRGNLADWDCSMKVRPMAKGMDTRVFGRWRETGVAFARADDAEGDETPVENVTLITGRETRMNGKLYQVRGYWGDITASPYATWGIECEEEEMWAPGNEPGTFKKTQEEFAAHNLKKAMVAIEESMCDVPVALTVLVGDAKQTVIGKGKYAHSFDLVFLGSFSVGVMEALPAVFRTPGMATLVVETGRYLIDLSEKDRMDFEVKISSIAKNIGARACPNPKDAPPMIDVDGNVLYPSKDGGPPTKEPPEKEGDMDTCRPEDMETTLTFFYGFRKLR